MTKLLAVVMILFCLIQIQYASDLIENELFEKDADDATLMEKIPQRGRRGRRPPPRRRGQL